MLDRLLEKISSIWSIRAEFRLKVFFLAVTFFLLTACQAIWRPMKMSIFLRIVGVQSIPTAKILLMFPIIILIFIYSHLVDWLRRHQLLYVFTLFHGGVGIILYFFLAHPVYGIANTDQSSTRLFGWIFYFFMESFGAFMSATFWGFANSINKPSDAKNHYGILVSGSKIGGVLGAGLLYFFTTHTMSADHVLLPNFLLFGCFLLFAAAGMIYLLMKKVPGYYMHGYEAAYQIEKLKAREHIKERSTVSSRLKNMISGLWVIIKNPYVFGIFSLIMSYEIIIVIIDYIVANVASSTNNTTSELTAYYALYYMSMHAVGLAIAFFGTAPLQRILGIRLSLFACPIISIMLLITTFFYPTPSVLLIVLIILRALNYGLNHPTREALFIPTTKEIKFKAKAWTDAFGSRLAKASGSGLNKFILQGVVTTSAAFGIALAGVWIVITYFLGKTFQDAIDNKKVIGAEKE